MTSSNGIFFRVTGPLWGESTVRRWILLSGFPSQRPVTRWFDVFFDLRLNKRLRKQSRRRWFESSSRSLRCHCNDTDGKYALHFWLTIDVLWLKFKFIEWSTRTYFGGNVYIYIYIYYLRISGKSHVLIRTTIWVVKWPIHLQKMSRKYETLNLIASQMCTAVPGERKFDFLSVWLIDFLFDDYREV